MKTNEIRVRPVIRHVITRYSSEELEPGRFAASCESLGEFANEAYAEQVAEALKLHAAPREYVIVQHRPGETEARVMYAYSEAEVGVRMAEMATPDGPGCSVFSRVHNTAIPA